mmetsp:Transcript_29872/g.72708  ORF Transcript_29872/g.72708 Transcript_29872/m.72708 type:complete len:101 (+) Transcript_29872:3859-4161(+)
MPMKASMGSTKESEKAAKLACLQAFRLVIEFGASSPKSARLLDMFFNISRRLWRCSCTSTLWRHPLEGQYNDRIGAEGAHLRLSTSFHRSHSITSEGEKI